MNLLICEANEGNDIKIKDFYIALSIFILGIENEHSYSYKVI